MPAKTSKFKPQNRRGLAVNGAPVLISLFIVLSAFSCYIYRMTKEDIARFCKGRSLRWTSHILERIFRRGISTEDVICALTSGEIIEQYPSDYPFPSCLVLGFTKAGKALHIVCGSNGEELWLVTAYIPNPVEWTEDFRQRSKQ